MTNTLFTVQTGEHFPATLEFEDALGNVGAAPTGEVPVWAVDANTILSVVADADGLSATITTLGPTGVATVTVTDTSLDGTDVITGTLVVTVTGGPVSQINIVPGAPVVNA